jgi:hypothetical protein
MLLQARHKNNCTARGISSIHIICQTELKEGEIELQARARERFSNSKKYALRTEKKPEDLALQILVSIKDHGAIGIRQIR